MLEDSGKLIQRHHCLGGGRRPKPHLCQVMRMLQSCSMQAGPTTENAAETG